MDINIALRDNFQDEETGGAAWLLQYLVSFEFAISDGRGTCITMRFCFPEGKSASINWENLKKHTKNVCLEGRRGLYWIGDSPFFYPTPDYLTITFNEATTQYFINILKKQKRLL